MFFTMNKPKFQRYVLSIAHMDYTKYVGGIEKLVNEHSEIFQKQEISYVFLCPMRHKISNTYKMYIDDEYCGSFKIRDILALLNSWNKDLLGCQIHHIMYWRSHDLNMILNKVKADIYVYLHDYYLICNRFNLINSNGSFCGIGLPSPSKCFKCTYYAEEIALKKRLEVFYEKMHLKRVVFISPSNYVKNVWERTFPEFREKTLVIEHLFLCGEHTINLKHKEPLRVAFIGSPLEIKGWKVFEEIATQFGNDRRYKFYHLGMSAGQNSEKIVNIPVSFQHDGKEGMIKALKEKKIDCAIIYPQWPETYNYTSYEAYIAGAYIITNRGSGNIHDMVMKYRCGIVTEDKKELQNLFISGTIINYVNDYQQSQIRIPLFVKPEETFVKIVKGNAPGVIDVKPHKVIIEDWKGLLYDLKHKLIYDNI